MSQGGKCGTGRGCVGGYAWQGGHTWPGVCVVGDSMVEVCVAGDSMVGVCVAGGGACMAGGDSHCSGQYASYWNAFLSVFRYISIKSRSSLSTKVMVSNSTMKKNVIFTSCFACMCGCIPLNIDQKFNTFEVSIVSMAKYKNLSCQFLSANVCVCLKHQT